MKKTLLAFLILLSTFGFSQSKGSDLTSHLLLNLGYQNLNGNYFKIGPEVYLVQPNDNLIDLSLTANMAYFKKNFVIVPELGIGYQFNAQKVENRIDPYREYIQGTFYSARVNVSPWNVTPELGISILGLLEANVGYSFEFNKHKYANFDGIKFGLTFHIPTIVFVSEPGLYPADY